MAQATLRQAAPAQARPAAPPFRYKHNVYFQDGLLATALLAGLVFLAVGISLDAAGHVSRGMSVVVPVTLGAVALGALMSFSRFDSFFALSHALFTGLALILFLMTRVPTVDEITPFLDKGVPELQARAYFVLLRLLNWVDAAINRTASADNYVFIFEICFLIWWIAFLGMWTILRHGYIWRAVVPAGLVIVINAYYAPMPVWSLLGLFSVLSLFLLIRANLAEQQLRWRDQQVHVSSDVGWDFVRTGLTYSVIVLAAAWLLPGLGRNLQIRQMLAPLNEQWEATSQELNRLYQGLNRRTEAASGAFGRQLDLGGPRNVGNQVIFNVRAEAGRYWRAVTYDTYTGRGWLSTDEASARLAAYQPAPIAGWEDRAPLTQTITLMAPTANVVFGAPDIRQLDMPVDVIVAGVPATPLEAPALGDELPPAVEFVMVRAREFLDVGDQYTLLSSATTVSEQALQVAGTDYPATIVDRFVQLPEGFSPRVAELAQSLTLTATTPYEQAKAVESYLRTIPYNDIIEAPPAGADPIEYFLFDIQQGYCDYYATAMAMMLRSLGVPARAASGYAEGSFDEEAALYYVTERDAHTWVEVFFPGLGWIEFEPTAGESPLDRPTGQEDPSATIMQEQAPPTPAPNPEQAGQPDAPRPDQGDPFADMLLEEEEPRIPWWVWAILTPLLLVLGLLVLWRVRIAAPTAFTPEQPLILFERLQAWAARLGLAPQPHQTPYEQARRWMRAMPEGEPPIRLLTNSYVRYRFSGRAGTEAAAVGAVTPEADAWRTLQPVLWKTWLRKLWPFGRSSAGGVYQLTNTDGSGKGSTNGTAKRGTANGNGDAGGRS